MSARFLKHPTALHESIIHPPLIKEFSNHFPPIGFLGAGAMAEALIEGLHRSFPTENTPTIAAYEPKESRCTTISRRYPHIGFQTSYQDLLKKTQVCVIAVKPPQVPELLRSIREHIDSERHLVVSVAAGVTTQQLQEGLDSEVPVVRIMPNIACRVGCMAGAITGGEWSVEADLELVEDLFASGGGELCRVEESQMDAVTGLSGSGPAYVYAFLEALTEGGVAAGLDWRVSERLALQTLKGATRMANQAQEEGRSIASLRSEVCSAGGTTISGMLALESAGFRGGVMHAVKSATERAAHISHISQND